MKKVLLVFASISFALSVKAQKVEWISSTATQPWQKETVGDPANSPSVLVEAFPAETLQTIDGFGSCFNELGWTSLRLLSVSDQAKIFNELYKPGFGASFTLGRMPIGANDFSRDWYSYNENDQDFEMKKFSIKNDKETLIPFIKFAQKANPALKLWASPWSPPTWMKYNKHYALAEVPEMIGGEVKNGITQSQIGKEGTDMFIQEDRYFQAYSLYFKKFIQAYRKEKINIDMVMPQNEFNSAQWYPSCTWTPNGLSKFISYLGPEMKAENVKVFFGTLERPNAKLFEEVYANAEANSFVSGVGVQWAGKEAVGAIHKEHPGLKIYQSEHECGDGSNSWAYCEYSWDLLKHYILNGANAYLYWNTALLEGGVSRWGWKQNSLITINAEKKTFKFTPEFYLMKHLSHFVQPGAHLINTSSEGKVINRDDVLGWWTGKLSSNSDNVLAFKNADGSVAIVIYNKQESEKNISLKVGSQMVSPILKPKSFNTFLIK